jgi:PucR C-terminal helix-turn-helix domain/Purine catabolism regulatory protein-like family/GGDEF-like domain
VLLRDLIAVPELRLNVLHAPPGALDRVLRRAYATDLLRPVRYLSGGDLVVSGLVWRRSAADSDVFVRSLLEGDAAALAAGDALLGAIPGDLVDACRRHGLPLIEVPTEVSFADVIEHLMSGAAAERGARLSASLGRQRTLLSEVVAGRSLADLAARISEQAGHICRVLTPTGRHVIAGPSPLDRADIDRVTSTFLTAPQLPAVSAGGAPYSVFTVGQGLENRLTAWFVVAEGSWRDWDPDAVDAVAEFASIAALERSRRDEGLRTIRHIAEEAVGLADSGGSQVEVGTRLRQLGLGADGPMIAVAASFPGRPDMGETARIALHDVASWFAASAVAACGDGCAVALLPAAGPDAVAVARTALRRLSPGARRTRIAAGISAPRMPGALAGALDEARYSRQLAELRSDPVSVVAADEVTSYVLLLATVPDEVRRTFALRVLGPVLDYDERNAAGLRRTLEVFLECSGSWSKASDMLHLHVNTVRYRIGRVEDLTGRDLSRLEHRVDLFLALRSL